MKLKIRKLHPDAVVPRYATSGAGCFDLCAITEGMDFTRVIPGNPVTFRTGLAFEIPDGWVMKIYSRSGHGFKNEIRLANCVGVIDSDYRGEVMVRLTRDGITGLDLDVKTGDRIAQAMLERSEQVEFEVVDELKSTERGSGGFGHTGA